MTISATTQGLRMGVATSTSRPTVPFDGQVISETDTDSLSVYKGSAWAPVSGLTLIKTQTIGTAVSTVEVTGAFSSTYTNYRIVVVGGTCSGNNDLALTLGSTATGYYAGLSYVVYAVGTAAGASNNNAASWSFAGTCNTFSPFLDVDLFQPNIASQTFISIRLMGTSSGGSSGGYLNNTTQYTSFTLTPAGGVTLSGGTVFVYGYAKA